MIGMSDTTTPPPMLDYREPSEDDRAAHGGRRDRYVIFGLALPLMVFTCVLIEGLNFQAWGQLPKTYEGKWRVPYERDEGRWRQVQNWETGDASIVARPLTAQESAKMRVDVRRAVAAHTLRDVVPTLGVLQYPLVLVVLVSGLALLREARSRPGVVLAWGATVASVVAGLLAVYRGYFTSCFD